MSRLPLDTHLLIWAVRGEARLPAAIAAAIADAEQHPAFSVVSIREAAIKDAAGRPGFRLDARRLRQALLAAGLEELQVTAEHAIAVGSLPPLHRDPFDRLLRAQAGVGGLTFLTAERALARYPGPIRLVI